MKARLFFVLLVPMTLVTAAALADDKATCIDTASKGQTLRNAHKLVEAREQLRVCASAMCPAAIQTDCAGWLADVEKTLPTVVLTARSGAGADLVDVKVSVDGQPLVSKLDGQAVPMNAGTHTFHFEGADGTSLDQQVLVREGEKNQTVGAVLGAAPPAPAPLPATTPDTTAAPSSPLRTVGWALGAAGVAGLGVGAVFGTIAIGDKNGAHCVNNVCDPGTVSGIKSAALVSDIGWIAGGVLLASGAALVLFAPSAHHEPAAAVRVAPVLTANGGLLVAGGSW
jgi:hypothetical protein